MAHAFMHRIIRVALLSGARIMPSHCKWSREGLCLAHPGLDAVIYHRASPPGLSLLLTAPAALEAIPKFWG